MVCALHMHVSLNAPSWPYVHMANHIASKACISTLPPGRMSIVVMRMLVVPLFIIAGLLVVKGGCRHKLMY